MPDDPIKHVVVLMLENRSFDHILGGTAKMRAKCNLSGTNKYGRKTYTQQPGAARQVTNDPIHETKDVLIRYLETIRMDPAWFQSRRDLLRLVRDQIVISP